MRRAMRHAHLLGAEDLLLYKLAPTLISEMGGAFGELNRAAALITETLKLEESRFRLMLDKGLHLLDGEVAKLGNGQALSGDVAFKLYDTFGFPLDLTEDALRGQGLTVEVDGFNAAMEQQRQKARAAWKGSGDTATEQVWFDIHDEHGASEFLGYTSTNAEGKILALVKDGEPVESVSKGDDVALIANQTPFYGESGGQAGDSGVITTADGAVITVADTQKKVGALTVHMGKVSDGSVACGEAADFVVDVATRKKMTANHSATHLLHEVLRRELGEHVTQKGSLVTAEKLRFDFAHSKAVSHAELNDVEAAVNASIRNNGSVGTHLMSYDDALDFGAMALFGEKYGDEVRVVAMGEDDAKSHHNFSVELCGGTHVERLGDIGLFVIVSESAVSSGVRRIEALTGEAARAYYKTQQEQLMKTAGALKTSPVELEERVRALMADRKALDRELSAAKKALAMGGGSGAGASNEGPETINGTAFIGKVLEGVPAKELRGIADDAKKTLGSGVVALVAVNDGKAGILVGVTDDLKSKISAVDLVQAGAIATGGKGGGGRPDMAQAGGPNGKDANAALEAIKALL